MSERVSDGLLAELQRKIDDGQMEMVECLEQLKAYLNREVRP